MSRKDRLHDYDAVLDWIKEYRAENGFPPTRREIGEARGISSTACVNYIINELEIEGKLRIVKNVARGLIPL